MVDEKTEAAIAELIAIALQIIAAKLIDHDDDNQLRMGVVGRAEGARDSAYDHARQREHQTKKPGKFHRG